MVQNQLTNNISKINILDCSRRIKNAENLINDHIETANGATSVLLEALKTKI